MLTIEWQVPASECGAGAGIGKIIIFQLYRTVLLNKKSLMDDKLWGEISMNTEYCHALKVFPANCIIVAVGETSKLCSREIRHLLLWVFKIVITSGDRWTSCAFKCDRSTFSFLLQDSVCQLRACNHHCSGPFH